MPISPATVPLPKMVAANEADDVVDQLHGAERQRRAGQQRRE